MYKVVKVAKSEEDLERVREEARRELKELLWKEVWRDSVDLPLSVEKIRRVDDWFEVTAEV